MDVIVTRAGEYLNTIVVDSLVEAQAAYPGCEFIERTADTAQPTVREITKIAWISRFTQAELVGLHAALLDPSTPVIARATLSAIFQQYQAAPDPMNLDDPRLVAAVDAFVQLGRITPERAVEIRA